MCFSASASLVAAAGLTGVGIASLRRTRHRAEVPFAAIPLLFAAQQFTEGALWVSFAYDAQLVRQAATHVYSVFSHTLWPIYVPIEVGLLEHGLWRRRTLAGL